MIEKVYPSQKPTTNRRIGAAGGTWTYVDAALRRMQRRRRSGLRMPALDSGCGGFGGFSEEVWLVPTTSDAGRRFVMAFGAGSSVALPRYSPGTLAPLEVPIAVLGVGTNATDLGSFSGRAVGRDEDVPVGDDIDSAELFFDVGVSGKHSMFSEKDEDYDQDERERTRGCALRDENSAAADLPERSERSPRVR